MISYDLPQILFLIVTILKELNLLQGLREHKFKHSFQGTINPLCNCGLDIETSTHFSLHCPFFINERRTLLSIIRRLDSKLLDCTDYDLTQRLHNNTSQASRITSQLKRNFMTPFHDWDLTAQRLQIRRGSLLFTTKLPEIPGAHLINLRRMKDSVDLEATQWF